MDDTPGTSLIATADGLGRSRRLLVALVVGCTAAAAALFGPAAVPAASAQDGGIEKVDVSLSDQRVRVWGRDGGLIRDVPVSTGTRGRTTPGSFRVYNRLPRTVSTVDGVSTMRWMVAFNGGIGFHGIPVKYGQAIYTPLGIRPSSAGCVRMSDADAEWMYWNVPNGTVVNVK